MPGASPDGRLVVAAGAVVFRPGRREVLLVHRPRYDDWAFPKGKLDRGEHAAVAAVREVEEETGLRVRLGRPLGDQEYPVSRGRKRVHYWVARVAHGVDDDVSGYAANDEIDQVAWVPVEEARHRLSYEVDRATLAEAVAAGKRTETLLVVRHAVARSRDGWRRDDRLRPLLARGHRQAEQLVSLLAAYDVRRLVSSTSARCSQTLLPYAETTGTVPELVDVLTEEGAGNGRVARLVRDLLAALDESGPTALCTHRPVLPQVFDALGVSVDELAKGELVVVHLRRGRVLAVERHRVG